ncbi:GIY-YIG nuclease family protein [Shewanella sp.]|uniref:GIY-YIG nuclease family protein n=1 Tax=Shewanella sp. TaxID=50422 RepID=UPI001B7B5709|nr:GIY-YIG nuclease family protein [Shewanella sp.]MBP6518806.1 GIY-YIG nuclease family protein [Shewanella sp.]
MIRLSTTRLNNKKTLADLLFEEDELGLLDVQPLKAKVAPTDHIGTQFADISAFYEKHGRLPEEGVDVPLNEKLLARRLKGILANPAQREYLQAQDIFGLLDGRLTKQNEASFSAETKPVEHIEQSELVTSLADIFADDDDGLLDFDVPDIFNLRHISVEKKDQPDEIAQRQPCPNFPSFAPLFTAFHDGLKNGVFDLERFTHKLKIAAGDFFILNGLVGYVANVGERLEQYNGFNARLHLVFENGTEMHMLYQSLTHGLVRDKEGRKALLNGQSLRPSLEAVPTGIVYILKTLSTDPVLIPYKQNLYKIGFTEISVEERIRNAEQDSTFLEAPVKIVATNQCFNLNAQKLEALVHGFLAPRRLNLKLKSHSGQVYTPKEWFYVPLDTALAVIQHIVSGSISLYRLDNTTGKIVEKHTHVRTK